VSQVFGRAWSMSLCGGSVGGLTRVSTTRNLHEERRPRSFIASVLARAQCRPLLDYCDHVQRMKVEVHHCVVPLCGPLGKTV
jgi:hypothetical protein